MRVAYIIFLCASMVHVLGMSKNTTAYLQATAYGTRYDFASPGFGLPLFALFIDAEHTLKAGGGNASGELGDGTNTDRKYPVLVGKGFASVKKGVLHSVGLGNDRIVYTWGGNVLGVLGDGTLLDRNTPAPILPNVAAISTGNFQSFALTVDGQLWAWGLNGNGQLGTNINRGPNLNEGPIGFNHLTIPVLIGADYSRIVAGFDQALATKRDGSLWAWGIWRPVSAQGPVGVNNGKTEPTKIGSGFMALAAGANHALGIKDDGSLWGWGYGWAAGATERNGLLLQPSRIGDAYKAVHADIGLSVALKTDGTLVMWGEGGSYNAAYNAAVSEKPKVIGSNFTTLLDVGAGLKSDGSLWLWGTPQLPVTGATQIQNGPFIDGQNVVYQMSRTRPTQIGSDFKQITVGGRYILGLKNDGTAWAWGRNTDGQLGDGTTEDRFTPVRLGEGFARLEASEINTRYFIPPAESADRNNSHSFGIKADGSLWSWGFNLFGQLGVGDRESRSTPTRVGDNFRSVSAGALHSIGIKNDDTLWAWGNNQYGRLGDGTVADKPRPVLVDSGYIAAKAEAESTVAIKRDGSVWIWGNWPFGIKRGVINLQVGQYNKPTKVADGLRPVSETDFGRAVLQTAYSDADMAQAAAKDAPKFINVMDGNVGLSQRVFMAEDGSLWEAGPNFRESGLSVTPLPKPIPFRDFDSNRGGSFAAIGIDNSLWVWGDVTFGQAPIPAIPYFTVPRHSVILDPPETQKAVCLFDWAQVVYPTLFSPPSNLHESSTAPGASYLFRAFPGTQSYLGVADGVLYYLGPASNNTIARIGLVADWLERAACD